jgi:hypothetical protein
LLIINSLNDIRIKCDLKLIKVNKCIINLTTDDIIKSYPESIKILKYTHSTVNYNLLKNLRSLEELILFGNPIIQNICESTDSPNSKEFELSIKQLILNNTFLKLDILKYFKSLEHLTVVGGYKNMLKLTYFSKSFISLNIFADLSELLQYPYTSGVGQSKIDISIL